jgi:hypothetical protein
MRFRRKDLEIEAVRYTGKNATRIIRFMGCPDDANAFDETIHTLEGQMHISPGDWVVRGVQGEFYSVKPDIFKQTYERC